MCWMTIYRDDDGSAVADAIAACMDHERYKGGHAWGYAYVDDDGELVIEKGVGWIPPAAVMSAPRATVALAHTRLATRGTHTIENAHPFEIRDADGELVAALAHNGTWHDAPQNTERCDSYYIARLLEGMYRADPERDFGELVAATGRITGETLVVLHRDGSAYAHAGRFGITVGENCVRSSGRTPIPYGDVQQI